MSRSCVESKNLIPAIGTAAATLLIGLSILGCQEPQTTTGQDTEPGNPPQAASAAVSDTQTVQAKGRSQIWSENCMRCHNIRNPNTLSDAQWQVVVHQMRVRGNLLAGEHKAVLELMQASN